MKEITNYNYVQNEPERRMAVRKYLENEDARSFATRNKTTVLIEVVEDASR